MGKRQKLTMGVDLDGREPSRIHLENLGLELHAKGSKAACMQCGEELARTQGLTSWTVAPLNRRKGIWGLFT